MVKVVNYSNKAIILKQLLATGNLCDTQPSSRIKFPDFFIFPKNILMVKYEFVVYQNFTDCLANFPAIKKQIPFIAAINKEISIAYFSSTFN